MVNKYINCLFKRRGSFDHVIYITQKQLKAVECLDIQLSNDSKVQKVNIGFEYSLASKYDFSNIRFLSIPSLIQVLYKPYYNK